MPAQIERIRDISRQSNVTLGFIPAAVELRYPFFHRFTLFDDRSVLIDLFNAVLTSRGRSDVRLYRRLFDAFKAQATIEIDEILDRYLQQYLDLARPGPRAGRQP
jgi:hypothetical protein